MRISSKLRTAGVVALAVPLLASCTMVSALKPVAGDEITTLRIGAYDVLVSAGVAIKTAPVCKYESPNYTCKGSTAKGDEILVSAVSAKPLKMTVKVAGMTIYDGEVQAVIDKAGRR